MELKIECLNRLSDLYVKMKSDPTEYIRKTDLLQHLEWSMSALADSIWQDATAIQNS